MKNKSDTIIEDLSPGVHTLLLQKGELWSSRVIQLEPGERKILELDLNALPVAWKIESEPMGVDIFINDEFQGKTPLTVIKPVAVYDLQTRMEGFVPIRKEIKLYPLNGFVTDLQLKKAVPVSLNITPPDAEIRIDGLEYLINSSKTMFHEIENNVRHQIVLGEGRHKILATHEGMEAPFTTEIVLNAGKNYEFDIGVELNNSYLANLEVETQMEDYQNAKRNADTALGMGILFFSYSVAQYQQIIVLEDQKERYESRMLNAASKKESLKHYETAKSHGESIDRHNNDMIISAALSLGAFILYYWLDPEPMEKPVNISLQPFIRLDSQYGLGASFKW
jgi:PEGA domain-containing protein